MKKIAFLGCGNLGKIFLQNLLEQKIFTKNEILIIKKSRRDAEFFENLKIEISQNLEKIAAAEIIFLAIKPQNLAEINFKKIFGAEKIAKIFAKKIVISILAGAKISTISQKFGGAKIVRAMPNVAQKAGCGATGIFFGADFSDNEKILVKKIFAVGGEIFPVKNENFLDKITAISGSGPAYFFYFLEKIILAAEKIGFSKKTAENLARKTFLGAAEILKNSEKSPQFWRKKVTSRGGTTAAALEKFANPNFEKIILAAILAAEKRAREISENF